MIMEILLYLLLFAYMIPLAICVFYIDCLIQSSKHYQEVQYWLSKRSYCYLPIYNIQIAINIIRVIIKYLTNSNDNV